MSPLTRRQFLRRAAVTGAVASLSPRLWAQSPGSNGDVRVAVVGLNGRGRNHLSSLRAISGVRIAAICDVDSAVLARTAADLDKQGIKPAQFADLRALLDSPEIDAVTVATPNHWHALAAIWACQAGKDVYLEKPVSHNVWEGRQIVAAAQKHGRVVQAGVQMRSGEGLREAVQWIRSGQLGRIRVVRGFCYKRRKSIGLSAAPTPPPATVNYDWWLGPAAEEPPPRLRFHYDWHWFNAYGNGDVGNQGIHQMDVARWFLGDPGFPRETFSVGGRLGYRDDGETPNTQIVYHDFPEAPVIFEVRGLPATFDPREGEIGAVGAEAAGALAATMDQFRGVSIGNIIECEGGSLVIPDYFLATAFDRTGKSLREFRGADRHMQNFIDVVRSRKTADQFGPIEQGHLSSALCHLGGISHQLGRAVTRVAAIGRDDAFGEAMGRLQDHLAANRIDLATYPLRLGQPLAISPDGNAFRAEAGPVTTAACAALAGNDASAPSRSPADVATANALLTRRYRAPYTVPSLA